MFPKAHAAAYVVSSLRIGYYKVHMPLAYYAAYFSVRADEMDAVSYTHLDVYKRQLMHNWIKLTC